MAVMDTGTTGLFLPKPMYNQFKSLLQTQYCDIPYICTSRRNKVTLFDDSCGPIAEEQLSTLPDIIITLQSGAELVIDPLHYTMRLAHKSPTVNGLYYFCLQVFSMENNSGNVVLMGEAVLMNWYVEFDRKERRLGFARSIGNCTSTYHKHRPLREE